MNSLELKILLQSVDRMTKPNRAAMRSNAALGDSLKKQAANLRQLDQAAKQLQGVQQMEADLDKTGAALTQARQEVKNLRASLLAAGDQGAQQFGQHLENARKKAARLLRAQRNLTRGLEDGRARLRETGVDTDRLGDEQRRLAADTEQATAALRAQAAQLERLQARQRAQARTRANYQRAQQARANMAATGAAGLGTGVGLMAAIQRTMQPGLAFDQGMSKVAALARIEKTSAAYQQLQKQAEALGETTSFSATQAAEGMAFLAMAGFNTNQILQATPQMLSLAKAAGEELGMTADIASNILSGFRLEASQMGRVSDVLTATLTRSNVNLAQLGDTMKYVAPVATQVNASLEETAAMAGLLGNVGLQGSMAGTAMRAIYQRLAAPPKMALDAMQDIGLKATDAAGNLRAVPEILAEIGRKTENMGNAQRAAIFKQIAGMEAGAAFAELVAQQGAAGIEKFAAVLKGAGGEADRVAKTMGDNAAGDLKALQSASEAAGIAIGQLVNTELRGLIQSVTVAVRGFKAWVAENPALASGLLKVVTGVAVLAGGAGALAIAAAGIQGPFAVLKFTLGSLAITGLPALVTAFGVLKAALLGHPVFALAAVLATGAGLIIANWDKVSLALDPVFKALEGMAESVRIRWQGLIDWVAAIPSRMTDLGGQIINGLGAGIDSAWESVKAKFQGILDWLPSAVKEKLGIHSPSRVFAGFGANLLQGLGMGMDQQTKPVMGRMAALANNMKRVGAGLVLGAGISGAVAAGPAIAPHATAAPTTAPAQGGDIVIHVHAAQGQSAQEIAREVARQLEQARQGQIRDQRSQLYDSD